MFSIEIWVGIGFIAIGLFWAIILRFEKREHNIMIFTKKEALKFHRDMWTKIKEKYGNYPTSLQRNFMKREYIAGKMHKCINYCYLCEYASSKAYKENNLNMCDYCPIDWTELAEPGDPDIGTCVAIYKEGDDSIYKCAPINKILSLPLKEKNNGKNR